MPESDLELVTLDARARVADDAIERMRRCAASDPSIGIVMPVSIDARGRDPGEIAAAVRRAAVPVYPDVTTGDAPCVLVRRELRPLASRRDRYARARDAGYRSVLCDDACVTAPGARGDAPGPVATIGPVRRMIRSQLAMVGRGHLPGILHVVHPRGGGTEKHIRELVAASSDEYRHYFLRIHPDRWLFKEAGDRYAASYAWPRDGASRQCLREMAAWLRLGIVHVHSLVGSGDDFIDLLEASGLPYCYTAHDMYLPCPAVYLIDSRGDYCNATTDAPTCRRCLAGFGMGDVDIERWRERYASFVRGAAVVHAPSQWAGDALRTYYPEMRLRVSPHRPVAPAPGRLRDELDPLDLPDDACRNVGILGAIGPEKGARIVDALADVIRARRLPLRLVVIGFTDRTMRMQSDDRVVTVHGRYRGDEVEALLDHYRISVVAFPTIWPETWSYTLAEAWRAGRPALVPPRGALMERVKATGAGWILDRWPDVDALADRLVELTSPAFADEVAAKRPLARAAYASSVREGSSARSLYRDVRHVDSVDAAPRRSIYEAACRAMGVPALPSPVVAPVAVAPVAPLRRLARRIFG